MIVYQTPFVKIFYDETVPAIYEEWFGQLSSKEFRKALNEKLNAYNKLKKNHEHLYWLNDVRKLRGLTAEDQQWAVNEFHPNLYPAGVRKIAFIVPERTYTRLSDEEITGKFDSHNEVEICYFDDFESAYAWFLESEKAQHID